MEETPPPPPDSYFGGAVTSISEILSPVAGSLANGWATRASLAVGTKKPESVILSGTKMRSSKNRPKQ